MLYHNWITTAIRRLLRKQHRSSPSLHVDTNNPADVARLKDRLLALKAGEIFEGVVPASFLTRRSMPLGFPFMKGWSLRRQVVAAAPGQKILILFNGYAEKAIVWVE